ncbi:hypothetical protein MKX03_029278, partial [Papaver bracteatum]
KMKARVKKHDAEINTGYVLIGCIFSKMQLSPTKSSIVVKAIPSSLIIKKRSHSCIGRRVTLIILAHDRRAQESILIVLLNLHNSFVDPYMLPVLEDYSLGKDGERMLHV